MTDCYLHLSDVHTRKNLQMYIFTFDLHKLKYAVHRNHLWPLTYVSQELRIFEQWWLCFPR